MGKKINRVGEKYGRLVVIEQDYTRSEAGKVYWRSLCDCGNYISVIAASLKSGNTRSCGCLAGRSLIDETGNVYGKWTVIKRVEKSITHDKRTKWLCKCKCGVTRYVRGRTLRSGMSKSCGCTSRLLYTEASFRGTLNSIRSQAEKRGLVWRLTDSQFREITQKDCFYCGIKPAQTMTGTKRLYGNYIYNGIDRVNNARGYEMDNVVACCGDCNRAKGTRELDVFLEWAVRLYNHIHSDGFIVSTEIIDGKMIVRAEKKAVKKRRKH